jgi:hypothetical protein
MFTQLRSGALECFTLSGVNVLSTLIPTASIWGVGFAWKDYDTLWRALDGKLGAYLRAQIDKAGLVAMDKLWDNGFRQITTGMHPIVTPADLKGMKIRVPISALWTSLFGSLGAAPTGINFAEVYSALQTKVVDGQENPPAIIAAAKLYEVQKYCSLTNHMWDGWHVMLMGSRAAGGFGLLFPEQIAITPDGRTTTACAGIWSNDQIEGLSRVTSIIKLPYSQSRANIPKKLPDWGVTTSEGSVEPRADAVGACQAVARQSGRPGS